jgi:hypothetical protein
MSASVSFWCTFCGNEVERSEVRFAQPEVEADSRLACIECYINYHATLTLLGPCSRCKRHPWNGSLTVHRNDSGVWLCDHCLRDKK